MASQLRRIGPPSSETIEEDGEEMKLESGAIAQGFRGEDDRYYERITYPSGKVIWCELID